MSFQEIPLCAGFFDGIKFKTIAFLITIWQDGCGMYRELISPILDHLDSETMHVAAKDALNLAESNSITLKLLEQFAYKRHRLFDRRLEVILGDTLYLDNPVIVGAGWDKTGSAVKGLYQLGFSGVEIGSVTEYPQLGNPKPRQFMMAPGVALNRLGFNSPGMEVVYKNIQRYLDFKVPFGISIGKNKWIEPKDAPATHAVIANKFRQTAYYFAINVSSPNTPGLRDLQDKGPLTDIVQAVKENRNRQPIYVKISPDLTYQAVNDVIEVVLDNKLNGIIATNTTIRPDLKAKYGPKWIGPMGEGGLSGDDLEFRSMSTKIVAHIYNQVGDGLEIIGAGGVKDASTALEKIMAGAKAVQVVAAIRGEGTSMPGRTNRGIIEFMNRQGVKNLSELVGVESSKYH